MFSDLEDFFSDGRVSRMRPSDKVWYYFIG